MTDQRPTPEQMLARLKTETDSSVTTRQRGRLKIFFGYAAGVGKTYAMLQEARRLAAAGGDVVAGYVEPHGRLETEALVDGLEQLPTLRIRHGVATLNEFNLDAALDRHPDIILVDELAHSNPPTCRHPKRWQDIDELLDAGINVFTSCNVQHIESLNDVVAKISGVVVRETVPDRFIDNANEVALIDISPEGLIERLDAGKVYIPQQAKRALQNFFRRENLVALRELALRQTADRVHVDVESARASQGSDAVWATNERLLVCIGPSPTSAKVIRAAHRLAHAVRGSLIAVHVENAATASLSEESRGRLLANIRLAEQLGAETVTLSGNDVAVETLQYAQRRNVTKLVIGKSERPRWPWSRSLIDRLIRDSGEIDIYVIRGIGESIPAVIVKSARTWPSVSAWCGTVAVVCIATLISIGWRTIQVTEANIAMTYVLGVVIVASRFGRLPAITASAASVLMLDLLFVEPYYTIVVNDAQYLVTFAIMLCVGMLIATLTSRIRHQADLARENERRTESLFQLNKRLADLQDPLAIVEECERVLTEAFAAHVVIFLPREGEIRPLQPHLASFASDANEIAVAQWVFDHAKTAGHGTDTLPAAHAFYLPLQTPAGVNAVLAIQPADKDQVLLPTNRQLLDAYATQIASALDRVQLQEETQTAKVRVETEQLRSTLLSTVSHDIRTPLAIIAGTASTLRDDTGEMDADTRRDLLTSIYDESDHLTRLVENLLRMTQLSSGKFEVVKEWHPLEDVVGSALRRLESLLSRREITIDIADDVPMGHFDAILMEQVLVNLIENAVRYTPPKSSIRISAKRNDAAAKVGCSFAVADQGPGLQEDELGTLFDTFQRGSSSIKDSRGAGLGLAISRAIVQSHGGTIGARNQTYPSRGAVFEFTLPDDGRVPTT